MRSSKLPSPWSFALAAIVSSLVCADAHASTSIALGVDDLARASDAVARVTPIASSSAWENGRIVTTTRARVDAVVAGSAPTEVSVRTLGGIVDGIGQSVEGEAVLDVGSPAILFLARVQDDAGARMRVVGRAQGRWVVARDGARDVVRVRATGALVARRPDGPVAPSGALATSLDGAPLEQAVSAAASAWRSTHAR